ncbi:hemolysin family protein [Spongisporangium articulatum]|uniref:Hemolysin family protein n=1 Tax=Spongisporangium articulatum TaxID=3362603 RepID=A0ABW8AW17_9ACTN
MSDLNGILITVGLLLLNAFFVGAEFAVISARRSQVEPLAEAGSMRARTVLSAMERVSLMLACAQLGITVCSLGLGAVAEPTVAHLIERPFGALGLPEDLLHPVAFAIALTLVVYLHVVIGEMIPKNLALAGPNRAALLLAPPLVAIARAVSPIIVVLNWVANMCLRLLRVDPKDEVASAFTLEEVASFVNESAREGLVDQGLLTGAIEFSDRRAGDVMVPVERLMTVPFGATPADVDRMVARTGFSRFPVSPAEDPQGTPQTTGELVGYLHIKDLLYADDGRHEEPVPEKRIRSLTTVLTEAEVEEVLETMQRAGTHLARVADRDGTTAGVVFLEDVLEELVGEVRDATRRDDVGV